jgi:hypothetical protein
VARRGLDPSNYAGRLATLFTEDLVVWGGSVVEQAARRIAAGVPWEQAGTPAPLASNGSAMRAAPIGLFFARAFGSHRRRPELLAVPAAGRQLPGAARRGAEEQSFKFRTGHLPSCSTAAVRLDLAHPSNQDGIEALRRGTLPPADSQGRPVVVLTIRGGKHFSRKAIIDSLRRDLPANLIGDALVKGKSWDRG